MKENTDSAKREMDKMRKGIENFRVKYINLLKKYQENLLVSARRIVEKRKEINTITVDDIKIRRKEINEAIDKINGNLSTVNKVEISSTMQKVEMKELEVIRLGIEIMKRDLPKLLSKKNFSFPKEYERIAEKEFGVTVRNNFSMVIKLKEDEITLLFSFLHSLYKELPSIIKGKGGVVNENKEIGVGNND